MEDVYNVKLQMNQPLVLGIAAVIGATFVFIVLYDSFRRRKRGRSFHRSSRPHFFKRMVVFFRELRREMQRHNERKARRRDRHGD
jgi:hypothetical protein